MEKEKQKIAACWKCGGPAKVWKVYDNDGIKKGAFLGWTCGCRKRDRCGAGERVLHTSRVAAIEGWNAYTARRSGRILALEYAIENIDESLNEHSFISKDALNVYHAALVEILEEEKA